MPVALKRTILESTLLKPFGTITGASNSKVIFLVMEEGTIE